MTYKKVVLGFTIVELLVVMAVLSILAIITITAINPSDQLAKSRNTKRRADIEAIANALQQHAVDNKSNYHFAITETPQYLSSNELDLCSTLVTDFIPALPQDPENNNGVRIPLSQCEAYDTYYTVRLINEDHIIVEAPHAELDEEISETR